MNNRIDGFKSRSHTAEERISEMEIMLSTKHSVGNRKGEKRGKNTKTCGQLNRWF